MKKILIIGMILLNLCLVLATQVGPNVELYATNVTGDSATLVAYARDLYDNAQIEWIKIYENGIEKDIKYCELSDGIISGCIFELDVIFPEVGQVNYYAVAKDVNPDNPYGRSETLTFNLAPLILEPGITIINIDKNTVRVEWDTDVDSTSVIKYDLDLGYPYTYSKSIDDVYGTNPTAIHSITLYNLQEGEKYYYVIENEDAEGNIGKEEGNFTSKYPNAPIIKNILATLKSEDPLLGVAEFEITWDTYNPLDEASLLPTDGVVYYKTEDSISYIYEDEVGVDKPDHSVTLTGLQDDATYYYYVESTNPSFPANPGISGTKTFTTSDLSAPEITGIREEDVYLTSARIKWDTDEPATSRVMYDVVSRTLPDDYEFSEPPLTDYLTDYKTDHNILLENLLDGETYYYIIESTDVDGNTDTSMERIFTTGRLIISFNEPDEDEEFYVGDVIEGELRIENADVSDIKVDVEIVFYDDTENDEIEEIEFEDKDIDAGEHEDFDFEFDVNYNIDEGHSYQIYVEVRADGTTYKHEIDIDVDRKANDVRVENMRVNRIGGRLEVNLDVINYGKRDQENVYVEVSVFGLGLNKISDDFSLEDWEGNNRVYRRFSFDLPLELDEGVYSVEAALHYGSSFDYVTKDFEVRGSVSSSDSIFRVQDSVVTSGLDYSEDDVEVMKKVTWGIIDFLLLCVVIYGFVWLINNR